MIWKVYLSGEIHSNWRSTIEAEAAGLGLPVEFSAPVTDHAASDDCGSAIMGAESNKFWHDQKGAKTQCDPDTDVDRVGGCRRGAVWREVPAVERSLRCGDGGSLVKAPDRHSSTRVQPCLEGGGRGSAGGGGGAGSGCSDPGLRDPRPIAGLNHCEVPQHGPTSRAAVDRLRTTRVRNGIPEGQPFLAGWRFGMVIGNLGHQQCAW